MTVVNFSLQEPGASGRTPATGRLTFQRTERRVDGSVLVLPGIFSVPLVAGAATVDLDPGVYFIEEKTPYGESAFRLIPEVGPVNYASLVAIDPATLAPAEPTPAWVAALMEKASLSGAVFTGNVTVQGADFGVSGASKAYRFRRGGGGLDFEGAGADLVLSMWGNPDFTGQQFMYDKFTFWEGRAFHTGIRHYSSALFGGTVQHTIDPVNNLTGWYGAAPVGRQVVTGSRASGAALQSLLQALTNLGWIDNQTVA